MKERTRRWAIRYTPDYVLEGVYKKWKDVKKWDDDLWQRCDMCIFVERCHLCPLPLTGFCCGNGEHSTLCFMGDYNNYNKNRWLREVGKFNRMILTELKKRKVKL
jgi:hypothetical protein